MQTTKHGVWDQISGSWKQLEGQVRKQWGKLTDDDMQQIKGQRDVLVGKLQQRYGIAEQEAGKQVDEWANRVNF